MYFMVDVAQSVFDSLRATYQCRPVTVMQCDIDY